MIATTAAIAGKKNVQQSLRSRGIHFLALVVITAIIWKPTYINSTAIKVATTAQLFLVTTVAIVVIISKPAFIRNRKQLNGNRRRVLVTECTIGRNKAKTSSLFDRLSRK